MLSVAAMSESERAHFNRLLVKLQAYPQWHKEQEQLSTTWGLLAQKPKGLKLGCIVEAAPIPFKFHHAYLSKGNVKG